ncbi:MAG TPA: SDR family NAD(P)-dependent oxidoreductase, partial [Acidimicrobiales bacterium]|nr:SDR family NAD(P)-dependent oxidoreductase [Acidimicrobiales bacterium]
RVEQLSGPARRRLRLPTYPFQRERYWIEPGRRDVATTPELTASAAAVAANEHGIRRIDDIDDWFWEPAWIDAARTSPVEHAAAATGPWLLVGEPDDSLIRAIAAELGTRGVEVRTAAHFDPVQLGTTRAVAVVGGGARDLTGVDGAAKHWLGDAADAARALGAAAEGGTRLAAITRGATAASGAAFRPVDALALGPVLVAPQEYPDLATLLIDVDVDAEAERSAPAIVDELLTMSDRVVALRRGRRLIPELVRTPVAAPSSDRATFRAGGTYVVTGGLGGIGHAIAAHLATTHQANLVVVASEPVPAGDERAPWLARHGRDDATSRRITRLAELEQVGTKVAVVVADLADAGALRHALDEAERVVGRIDGAIHAAGRVRDRLIELATREDHEAVIGPKARAAAVLAEELERRGADLLVLVSSTSTALAPSGQTAYVAANAVLDSLAGTRARLRVVTINYGVWAGTGMAAELARRTRLGLDDGEPIVHPVLTQRHTDRAGNVSMTGTLDATHDWVVDEHRVEAGTSVLPGSAHLELMLAAAEFAAVGGRALRDVALVAPLVVTDDHPVAVKVTVTSRDAAGKRYVRIESDGGTGRSWHAHSEAELATNVDNTEHRLDLVGIVARCGLDGVDPLMSPRRHIHFGPRWDAVVDAALGDGESVGRLRLADAFVHDAGAWTAHPAIVDVATAFGVLLGHADDDRVLYVPIGYDSVVSHAPLAPEVHVHAVRTASTRDDLLRVDIALTDAEGRVQLQIGGLSLRPVRDPARFGTTAVEVDGAATRLAPLLALAEVHGIRSDEGPRLLERVLARDTPRLVASSVDLAALLAPTVPEAGRAADQEPTAGRAHAAESVAEALTAIWVDLLGVSDITPDDDFFELGGHSLIAIRLMARVHRELGVRFQLATLFEAPTIASLAALIRAERPDLESALQDAAAVRETTSDGGTSATAPTTTATPSLSIVAIRATGAAEPLYVVHGAGGNVLNLWSLARALPEDRPLYGFQAHGVDGQDEPDPTIDAMAARYVDALRAHKPGPYLLGGYSGGGIVALEMAAKLRAAGEHVRYVVLFDSIPPEHVYPRNTTQLRHVIANLCIRGPKPVWPYLDEWARRTFRRVVPTPEARERARREQAREMGFIDVSEFGFVNLEPHFARIVREHRLGIYAVDALLLKADEVWPIHRHDYFWGGVITGTLDIRTVPGNHNTMFNPEHAATLAAALVPLLEAHAPR